VTALAFHPSGRLVFTACADGRLRAWETITGKRRSVFRTQINVPLDLEPRSLECDSTGTALAVIFGNWVERWDLTRASFIRATDHIPLPVIP
jgi:hypothetical protein